MKKKQSKKRQQSPREVIQGIINTINTVNLNTQKAESPYRSIVTKLKETGAPLSNLDAINVINGMLDNQALIETHKVSAQLLLLLSPHDPEPRIKLIEEILEQSQIRLHEWRQGKNNVQRDANGSVQNPKPD